jgi:ABC-type transporter Mla subunit MlaD
MFMWSIGLAGLLLAGVVMYIGYEAPNTIPGRSYYNLKAAFRDAENLGNHYEVRIGGLRAGQVLNPRVKDGLAVVDLELSSRFKPLLSDMRLQIRLRSAVGIRYVEIIPGTKGHPLPDGATIPASQSATPVALDQVLGTFDARTRIRTQQFLQQLGAGTAGRGEALSGAIAAAPAFLNNFASVSSAVTARAGAMSQFVRSTEAAAAAFAPVRDQIAQGFDPETRALQPFTNQAGNVQATLEQAPSTLSTISSDLPAVTSLVGAVDGLAREGDPTLAALPPALRATSALLHDAQPSLRRASETLALAHDAVPPTLALLQHLSPVLPDLNTSVADALPTVSYIAPRYCELSNVFTGWSEFLKWGTSYSNFIRFDVIALSNPLAGGTGSPLVPTIQNGTLTNAYPGPCVHGFGEAGPPRITTEQSAKGLTYSAQSPPKGPVLDLGSAP